MLSKPAVVGALDQASLSLANLTFAVLVAQTLGPEGLGRFLVLYGLAMLIQRVQAGLICMPLVVDFAPERDDPGKFAQRYFSLQMRFLLTSSALLPAVAWIIVHLFLQTPLTMSEALIVPLGAAALATQEFQRRWFLAIHPGRPHALWLTLLFGCASVLALLLLRSQYEVSIELAFVALSLGAIPSLLVFYFVAQKLRVSLLRAVELGQWRREGHLVAGNILGWANQQGITYIVAALLTPHAVGIFAAVRNLFAPIGVLLLSLESFLPSRMAYVVRRFGHAVMWKQVLTALATSAVLMTGMAIVFLEYGRGLIVWLYGAAFAEAYSVSLLLSLSFVYLFALASQILAIAARVLQQPRQIVLGRLAALVTLIGSTLVLVPLHSIDGAGMALAAADLACAAWIGISLYKYSRHSRTHKLP